jgi:hypothetical protein
MSDTEEKPIARPPELPAGAVLLKAAFAFPQSDLWLLPGSPARVWKTWYRGRSPLQRRMGRFLAAREARIMRALELTGRVLVVEGHGPRARAQIDFGDQVIWLVLRHAPIEKI